jgi:hypothetical protein
VAIYGSNLAGATAVYFGSTPGHIISASSNGMGVVAPPHNAGVVDVTVVTPGGTSAITPADEFTYGNGPPTPPGPPAPAPTVQSVAPNSGSTTGGYQVAISGANLGGATAVYFGTTAGHIQNDTGTVISVVAPPHTAGTVDVTVVTPSGTSATSTADQFTYTNGQPAPPPQPPAPAPTVQSVTPNSGSTAGGYQVTVSGSNLGSASAVYFGTTAATIQTDGATAISVLAPAHSAGTVDVTVVTSAGTSATSTADQFTYTSSQPSPPPQPPAPAPTVQSVTPNSGSTAGGYQVTVTGSNLGGATAVYFGTTAATIQSDNPSAITVLAPSHSAGTVDVTVVTSAGTSATSTADRFTYTSSQPSPPPQPPAPPAPSGPAVQGVAPYSGSPFGGYEVAVYGANLSGATAVYFGPTAGHIIGVSATAIGVIVPPHAAGVVDVTVVTPAGRSAITTADNFTYVVGPPTAAATVQRVAANTGSKVGGYQASIFGTNLGGAKAVYFGSTRANILGVTPTGIVVTVPAQAAGTVDVTVVTAAGKSAVAAADHFTYTSAAPSHIAAPDAVMAGWSPQKATEQQIDYLLTEILTGGGVSGFTTFFSKKPSPR